MHGNIDSRVNDYKNLDGMYFYYCKENNDVYTYLTSGVGVGHPVLHFTIDDDEIKFNNGVVHEGRDIYSVYDESKNNSILSKENMYNLYEKNKSEFDVASSKIEEDSNLSNVFNEQAKAAGMFPPTISSNTNVEIPSALEIRNIYLNTLLYDMFTDSEEINSMKEYENEIFENFGIALNENGFPNISISPAGNETEITIDGNTLFFDYYIVGGVDYDGNVEKDYVISGYYNLETKEHGSKKRF